MPTCFLCKEQFVNIKVLFKHLDLYHSQSIDSYVCAEGNCSRSFSLKNSFRKHLSSHNTIETSETSPDIIIQLSTSQQLNEDISLNSIIPTSNNVSDPREFLNKSISCFLASLYANPIMPRNAVQLVVDGIDKVITQGILPCVDNYAEKLLNRGEISPESFEASKNILKVVENPLDNFKSEHKRFKYFSEQLCTYIEPREIVIGQRLNTVLRGGLSTLEPCNCTMQFMPLRQILQKFFSLENVLTDTLKYMESLSNNHSIISNFIQGSFWQSKLQKHNGRTVLPLFMFFDDFESGNILGSHSGIHKLGAVYVSVACLPPHLITVLSNIFMVLLFHSADREEFKNNIIFRPLIDEFNFLQSNGIEINTPLFQGKLYFDLGLILGDNLGLHAITGFTESFSSNFPCRFCMIHKDRLKILCYEDETLLRNVEQHNVHVIEQNMSASGVKEECVWLCITHFSLFDQVGVDWMHDFLEGSAKYIFAFTIPYYVNELKLFSLEILNNRMFGFDFGPEHNRPSAFTKENVNQGNIRQSASEMLVLIRYFGLIIGDFVPVEEPVWTLYMTMRRTLDIMLSVSLEKDSCSLLRTLVGELNELYLKYSKKYLKPKFHFMLHYPALINKFGPISHLWSMRFETKHRTSKISARSNFNRRNICLSLAIKHQLQLNETFLNGKLCNTVFVGPYKFLNSIKRHEVQTSLNLSSEVPLKLVNWAKVKGTHYKINTIVTKDILEDDYPIFASIINIFLYGPDRIIFEVNVFSSICFDEHVFCYEINKPDIKNKDSMCYIFQDSLISPVPNSLNIASNGKQYVTVRSPF